MQTDVGIQEKWETERNENEWLIHAHFRLGEAYMLCWKMVLGSIPSGKDSGDVLCLIWKEIYFSCFFIIAFIVLYVDIVPVCDEVQIWKLEPLLQIATADIEVAVFLWCQLWLHNYADLYWLKAWPVSLTSQLPMIDEGWLFTNKHFSSHHGALEDQHILQSVLLIERSIAAQLSTDWPFQFSFAYQWTAEIFSFFLHIMPP